MKGRLHIIIGLVLAGVALSRVAGAQECPLDSLADHRGLAAIVGPISQASSKLELTPSWADKLPLYVHGDPCGGSFSAPSAAAMAQIDKHSSHGLDDVQAIPVVFQNDDGPVKLPVWRVQSFGQKAVWVDEDGRVYSSWNDWKDNNKLPSGKVTYPDGGTIFGSTCGGKLDTSSTPASSFWHRVSNTLTTISIGVGIAVGVATIIGTGGLAVPVLGLAAAAWQGYHYGSDLADMHAHEQSINPLNNSEARHDWLAVGGAVAGTVAMGAQLRAATLAARGEPADEATALASKLSKPYRIGKGITSADTAVRFGLKWKDMDDHERTETIRQLIFWKNYAPDPTGAQPINH